MVVVLVFIKFGLLVVMCKDAVSVQVPRWPVFVVGLVDLAHVEPEVVGDLPVVLRVVPREIGKLALHVLRHVLLPIFVIVQVSAQVFVRAVLRRLSFLALLDFIHVRAQVRVLSFRLVLLLILGNHLVLGIGFFRLLIHSLLFLNFLKPVFDHIDERSALWRLILRLHRLERVPVLFLRLAKRLKLVIANQRWLLGLLSFRLLFL